MTVQSEGAITANAVGDVEIEAVGAVNAGGDLNLLGVGAVTIQTASVEGVVCLPFVVP